MNTGDVSWQVLDGLVRSEVLMFGGRAYTLALAAHLEVELSVIYGALRELVQLGEVDAPGDLQRRLGRAWVTPPGYQRWLTTGTTAFSHDFGKVKQVVLEEVGQNTVSAKATVLRRRLSKHHRIALSEEDLQIDLRLMRGAGWITTNPARGLYITAYAGPRYPGVPLAHWHL